MSRTIQQNDQDLALMRRVAANDEGAVGELYERFAPLVYRMALRTMLTRAETEDAVQEVFVRLWRTSGRYDPTRAGLVTWVMLITRRQLVDHIRRLRRLRRVQDRSLDAAGTPAVVSESSAEISAERDERDERLALIRQRIEILPPMQRLVVTRAYMGGQTLRQIGEDLGAPLGTVKTAMRRALISLRAQAGEHLRAAG